MAKRPPERFHPSGKNPTAEERHLMRPDTPTRQMAILDAEDLVEPPPLKILPTPPKKILPTPPRPRDRGGRR